MNERNIFIACCNHKVSYSTIHQICKNKKEFLKCQSVLNQLGVLILKLRRDSRSQSWFKFRNQAFIVCHLL